MKIRGTRLVVALSLLLFIIGGDAIVKQWALQTITPMHRASPHFPYGGVGIFQDLFGVDFSINLVFNRGMAWGFLSRYSLALFSFRLVLITALALYLFSATIKRAHHIPLLFILGGAIGNVFDYAIYGHVIDMFYFNFWGYAPFAVFNLADFFISMGIVILSLQYLLTKKNEYSSIPS